jgi:hypothetical protein
MVFGSLVAPLSALLLATFSIFGPPVLDPGTYRSANGVFELDVDPGEPDGSGPGRYRLERNGTVVWETGHPFTFFDAAVADDGTVAGVSYSRGLSGGAYGEDHGDLRLVVLDPSGTLRFEHVMPRRESRVLHGLPLPQSKGVLLDETNGRVLLRIIPDTSGTPGLETWWLHDLRTGSAPTTFDPQALDRDYLRDIRRLNEASRFLAHWDSDRLSRFAVLTPDLRPVWTYEIPRDSQNEPHRGGSIEAVTHEGFSLELRDLSYVIDFTVSSRDGVLRVAETGRRALVPPADPLMAARELRLPLLGTIELGADAADRSAVRSVYDFDIDGQGRLGFVRCAPGAFALVLVDDRGRVLSEVPLADFEDGCAAAAWLGGDVWVVATRSGSGKPARLEAVDLRSRTKRTFAEMEADYLFSLRGNGGRGLLILDGDVLRVLDSDGKEIVRLRHDYNDESALFSPEDMTTTPTGEILVLDNIRGAVQVFRADGSYAETIDLESALGKEASYPDSIAASPKGGFAVWDFGSPLPLFRLAEGGALVSERAPRYDDGRATGPLRNLRYAPDGALWASDGEALVRLNEEGIVDAVVGARPSNNRLTEAAATVRDRAGRFYLADRRTGSVHVFEPTGAFSHRCDPARGDFEGPLRDVQLSVSGDGTAYLSDGDKKHYVVFDAAGHRTGTLPKRIDTIKEDWFGQPRGLDRWVITMDELYLTDAEGKILHRIRRHGDRTWLDAPAGAAVASDGSVALLTGHASDFGASATLGMFNVDGEAVTAKRFSALPSSASIAFDSGLIVLGIEGRLVLLDAGGEPLGRIATDVGYDRDSWNHFLVGDELQLLDLSRRVVYRYDVSELR